MCSFDDCLHSFLVTFRFEDTSHAGYRYHDDVIGTSDVHKKDSFSVRVVLNTHRCVALAVILRSGGEIKVSVNQASCVGKSHDSAIITY